MAFLAAARIRAHTGNFHLVWRTFAKALVHERIYPCTRDGVDSWEAYWDPIVDAGGVKYFKPEDNRYFEHGFPLPERRGMHSNGETIRVFMDDLFLCPDCGALHKETNRLPDVPWMHWMHGGKRRIDAVVMWQAVETRFEKPEFVPQLCGNRKQCHETVKNVRRRVREAEINERLRRWAEQRGGESGESKR